MPAPALGVTFGGHWPRAGGERGQHSRRDLLRWVAQAVASTVCPARAFAQSNPPSGARRYFEVVASRYRFEPSRIEVRQNDLVRITLRTTDIPHSLNIEAYRVSKRASAGSPVTCEFRADQVGSFPIYCSLIMDDGCKEMRGELVVRPQQ